MPSKGKKKSPAKSIHIPSGLILTLLLLACVLAVARVYVRERVEPEKAPEPSAVQKNYKSVQTFDDRNFSADLYGFRLGPFVQIPVSRRFGVIMSGGLAIVSVNSEFQFRETITAAGVPSMTQSASGSRSDVLVGGYFNSSLYFVLTRSVDLFGSFQYQNVGTYSQIVSGKKATLDLGESIFLTIGAGYSF